MATILLSGNIHAQEKSPVILKVSSFYRHNPTFTSFYRQTRETPFRINPNDNISGPGLGATIGIYAEKIRTAVQYSHSIHMGITHYERFFVDTVPNSLELSIPVTKLIHDLELDVVKYFGKRSIHYFVTLGAAMMNLNTHYMINEIINNENGHIIKTIDSGNLILGGAKLGFGVEYNRLAAALTLFLCDHTVYQNRNPFIFPELKVSYSFLK